MGSPSRNMSAFKKGFARLSSDKDRIIEAGMRDLMESAMLNALGEHDATHWFHKSSENSYGWCVVHDGNAVAIRVNEGRHGTGNAYGQLMSVVGEVPQAGWVGILLASFVGGDERPKYRIIYFDVDFEMTILDEVMNHIETEFDSYFKPLT